MKLLLIYTGGTIGMVKDCVSQSLKPGGIAPIKEFLNSHNFFNQVAIVSTKEQIDSSNFGLGHFKELATIIEESYTQYDAFLVLMGTDTMAYVSSLLSYCISGLSKAIVFTGGQKPLLEKESDSKENLWGAIQGLLKHNFPKEVGVFFANNWLRAVGVTKIDSENNNAYMVPNPSRAFSEKQENRFQIVKHLDAKIVVVKLLPFGNEDVLRLILESNSFDGMVLEAFGTGNIPNFSPELKKLFTIKIAKGFKIVVVSQCLKSGVTIGKYQASIVAKSLGFISGNGMTTESAVSKMIFIHHKKLNSQEYQAFFVKSLKGE